MALHKVGLYFSNKEKQQIEKAAKIQALKSSSFCRSSILKEARKVLQDKNKRR